MEWQSSVLSLSHRQVSSYHVWQYMTQERLYITFLLKRHRMRHCKNERFKKTLSYLGTTFFCFLHSFKKMENVLCMMGKNATTFLPSLSSLVSFYFRTSQLPFFHEVSYDRFMSLSGGIYLASSKEHSSVYTRCVTLSLKDNNVLFTFLAVFTQCFLYWFTETRQHVNIDEWLDVWGGLLHSARTMEALPLWLQIFPKVLFQVINKSGKFFLLWIFFVVDEK